MSGITTTGATVITNLDETPKSILLWRAIMQWLGGIGIIVMAITILPLLKVGGMQLFKMEGPLSTENIAKNFGSSNNTYSNVFCSNFFMCFFFLLVIWNVNF